MSAYLLMNVIFIFGTVAVWVFAAPSPSVSTTFSSVVQFIDWFGGARVWYGLPLGCGKEFCGVATYSSTNLQTWHYNGLLFDPNIAEIKSLCGAFLSGNCGRPHIIHSAVNNEYVLWVDAKTPGYAIFTSNCPIGGFVHSESRELVVYQPPGPFKAGDFSVHPPFLQSIYVQKLTSDMRNTTGTTYQVITNGDLVDMEAEYPEIWKRGDYFYTTASNTCGFCQTTGVLTLPAPNGGSPSYIHMADLFRTAPISGTRTAAHGHQYQKLDFKADGSLRDLDCSPSKSVNVALVLGNGVPDPKSGCAVSARMVRETLALIQSPAAYLPLNCVAPTSSISITIFRYDNDTNFFTPSYVWETLTSFNVDSASLSLASQVVRVPVGKSVRKGDNLGFALGARGTAPMCILVKNSSIDAGNHDDNNVYGKSDGNGRTLFANGPGQVSLRGKDGNAPPVQVLSQELKWNTIAN
ncbi:uncharacterized protein RAG0_01306 [Rhynchosporium agropyri]|uniref:Uncharacterized protein n=1 Tax=Rhynchosporium agropyri TaxID=914238 RepID=A0A1E1JWB8_9HELO|nr:uncharacterized protein RAG0_01306 [Rhynchosporium agropyri]